MRDPYFADASGDFVLSFLRMLNAIAPEVSTNALLQIEQRIRTEFGGKRCYVRATMRRPTA